MAFVIVFLDRPGTSEAGRTGITIRDRTGAIEIPKDVFEDLDESIVTKGSFMKGGRRTGQGKELSLHVTNNFPTVEIPVDGGALIWGEIFLYWFRLEAETSKGRNLRVAYTNELINHSINK